MILNHLLVITQKIFAFGLNKRGSRHSLLLFYEAYRVVFFLLNTTRLRNSLLRYTVCTNTSQIKPCGKVKKESQQMLLLLERFRQLHRISESVGVSEVQIPITLLACDEHVHCTKHILLVTFFTFPYDPSLTSVSLCFLVPFRTLSLISLYANNLCSLFSELQLSVNKIEPTPF
jgi:hypothetical protein